MSVITIKYVMYNMYLIVLIETIQHTVIEQ